MQALGVEHSVRKLKYLDKSKSVDEKQERSKDVLVTHLLDVEEIAICVNI